MWFNIWCKKKKNYNIKYGYCFKDRIIQGKYKFYKTITNKIVFVTNVYDKPIPGKELFYVGKLDKYIGEFKTKDIQTITNYDNFKE